MSTKKEKIKKFDPNGFATEDTNIFGLPFNAEESDIILIPVPWEVTVSYGSGTAKGPKAIMEASKQVDLFHLYIQDAWKKGIFMEEFPEDLFKKSNQLRKKAEKYLDALFEGNLTKKQKDILKEINEECHKMNERVRKKCLEWLDKGKMVGLVGGDHSTPLGFIHALAERHNSFSILQIDAHADLRNAYEGFTYSHASVMFNATQIKQVKNLVQVGVRDLCEFEYKKIANSREHIINFHNEFLMTEKFTGKSWRYITDNIINHLGDKVYISFDIDGLDPKYCPNTGTPVPGGLEFNEAVYLIRKIADSGREIIGFDLNEVAPGDDEWDANVGARLLYELCNWMAASKKTASKK
jgi:agmatinase